MTMTFDKHFLGIPEWYTQLYIVLLHVQYFTADSKPYTRTPTHKMNGSSILPHETTNASTSLYWGKLVPGGSQVHFRPVSLRAFGSWTPLRTAPSPVRRSSIPALLVAIALALHLTTSCPKVALHLAPINFLERTAFTFCLIVVVVQRLAVKKSRCREPRHGGPIVFEPRQLPCDKQGK